MYTLIIIINIYNDVDYDNNDENNNNDDSDDIGN